MHMLLILKYTIPPIPSFFVRLREAVSPSRPAIFQATSAAKVKSPDKVGGLEPRAIPTSCRGEHGEAPPFERSEHGAMLVLTGAIRQLTEIHTCRRLSVRK